MECGILSQSLSELLFPVLWGDNYPNMLIHLYPQFLYSGCFDHSPEK